MEKQIKQDPGATVIGVRVAVALFCALLMSPFQTVVAQTTAKKNTARTVTTLHNGWRFQFGEAPDGVQGREFDDSAWQKITLPHTWNKVGYMAVERGPDANASRGVAWYRLNVNVPDVAKDRRYILQFDGVSVVSEVWVNGTRVGDHKGAYSRFRFDVTDLLKSGAENLIAVKADNSIPEKGNGTADVHPLGGDYFVFGGIYRGVSLISTASAQVDMLDYASPGVYIRTRSVTAEKADIEVRTKLRNFAADDRKVEVAITILDAANKTVASNSMLADLAKTSTAEVTRVIALAHPHLWNGRADPYLYHVSVELRDGSRVIDQVVEPLGVRTFSFDPDKGFVLNGKPTPLHGVSRHQDLQDKGWALSPEDHMKDMELIVEMGANTIRHAHYQHAQEWADLANKMGMAVWAELPFTHQSSLTHETPTDATVENAKTQLIELIRQNFNHPSIAIWSVGNEVDAGAYTDWRKHPGTKKKEAESLGLLKTLNELANQEDDSRPTAYADCSEQSSTLQTPATERLSGVTNLTAYNRYFGWYMGKFEDMGPAMDQLHTMLPKLPIGVSEYGSGAGVSQHTDNPRGGPVSPMRRPHPEEYQSDYHETTWPQLKTRPYLFGTWIWNMFDFPAQRAEGDTIDINDKGLVTRDRKIRKDAFFYYKANWSDQPVLYITSRRYVDRAYPVTDVRAYSNAPKATLTLNGKSLGEASVDDNHTVAWKNVRLKTGPNTIQVNATIRGKKLSDSVTWNAPDASAGLRIMAGTLTGIVSNEQRFGSDNFFVGGSGKAMNFAYFMGISKKNTEIAGTPTPEIFAGYREGSFCYELPLPDGKWNVTLYFCEPNPTKCESRTFDVLANGKVIIADFNPAQAAGGPYKATTKQFAVEVSGGILELDFNSKSDDAIVSAIVINR